MIRERAEVLSEGSSFLTTHRYVPRVGNYQ